MRILHVINALAVGGAERLLVDVLPLLRQRGEQVELLLLNGKDTPFSDELRHSGITLHMMNQRGGEYNPFIIWKLRKYVRRYDLIHVHLFPAQYWVAAACVLWRSTACLVTTEHNTYNRRCKYRLTSWLDRKIYACYDAIICISQATFNFMKTRTAHADRLCIIENGINVSAFGEQQPSETRLSRQLENCFLVMQVARFQPQKDQDCVIRALTNLPQQVHAVFVGGGERLEDCRKLAARLGVSDRTHFLGVRDDVPKLWSIADVGVMSSHWEGFGLAAAEGMATGKPVLVSRVAGLSDVVNEPKLQFEPGNASDLAHKILSLYEDSGLRAAMADYCMKRSRLFDVSVTVTKYRNLYHRLMNNKKRKKV